MVGNEACDAGLLEGCSKDCSSSLPTYSCLEGSPLSPSICTEIKNEEKQQAEAAQTAGRVGSAVTSSINVMAVFSSFLTLGPGLFMLIHLQAILCVLALIGELENPNIIQVLQTTVNPLDMNLIPDKWIPNIQFSGFEFNPNFNDELISKSGY